MNTQESEDHDIVDDYDEEADSDFEDNGAGNEADDISSSDEEQETKTPTQNASKKAKGRATDLGELDSGDEATIREQQKVRRKQKSKDKNIQDDVDQDEEAEWRAKTRSMREKEKDERKRNKLVTLGDSSIDVDKIWEEMNRPGPLPGVVMEAAPSEPVKQSASEDQDMEVDKPEVLAVQTASKEPAAVQDDSEMITIKRTYKFAGQIHVEEKVVARSSAEARLWLAQQSSSPQVITQNGVTIQRPLRKISRFDPNNNNLGAFKGNWTANPAAKAKATKLNVVEKSKMDWAVHVDAEGLKDELDEHAKAKEGYLNRMDFLSEVEQRKEADARAARLRGS